MVTPLRQCQPTNTVIAVHVMITFRTAPTLKTVLGNDLPVPQAGHLSQSREQAQPTSTLNGKTDTWNRQIIGNFIKNNNRQYMRGVTSWTCRACRRVYRTTPGEVNNTCFAEETKASVRCRGDWSKRRKGFA